MARAKRRRLNPAERMFVAIVGRLNPDKVTEAIENDIDLAERIKQKMPDMIPTFRRLAKAYAKSNPGYIRRARENPDEAISVIINELVDYSPEVAKRFLEGPPIYSAADLGLELAGPGIITPSTLNPGDPPSVRPPPPVRLKYPELGLDYAKRQMEKVMVLLGI